MVLCVSNGSSIFYFMLLCVCHLLNKRCFAQKIMYFAFFDRRDKTAATHFILFNLAQILTLN